MSDAAPPPWVRRLTKRDHGVDAGLKVLLITAWGFGPYRREGEVEADGCRAPAKPVVIHPSAETLAEESGQPLGTVKDQLRRAAKAGWIRRERGSRMTLAWREPGCFDYGPRTVGRPDRTAGRPSRPVDHPDGGPTLPDGGPTLPDGGPTFDRTVGRPLTFQLTSTGTSKDLPDRARAQPAHQDDQTVERPDQTRGLTTDQERMLRLPRRNEREPRAKPARPPDAVTPEHLTAIREVGGAWAMTWVMTATWLEALGRAVTEGSIDPPELGEILREHDRQISEAKRAGKLQQAHAGKHGDLALPRASEIWHRSFKSRDWLTSVRAKIEERRSRPTKRWRDVEIPAEALNITGISRERRGLGDQ